MFFPFSTVISSKLIIFVLFYYIIAFDFLLFHILDLRSFHMHMFLLNRLIAFLFIIISTNEILLNYSVNTLCFSLLSLYLQFSVSCEFFRFFSETICIKFIFQVVYLFFTLICFQTSFIIFKFKFLFYNTF